jgi:hypothetical protein
MTKEEFFRKFGTGMIMINDPEFQGFTSSVSIDELYQQFAERFRKEHDVISSELLGFAEIVKTEDGER